MKWMQFFTPVSSITWEEANRLMAADSPSPAVLLDVRQPQEYAAGHMPGARLIPIGELDGRLSELQPEQPVIVY
jgi:rhodanese-related sulfurtransferase